MKGGIGCSRIELDANRHYNFTTICCVYKEKMVKNDSCTEERIGQLFGC